MFYARIKCGRFHTAKTQSGSGCGTSTLGPLQLGAFERRAVLA
jgi:hypothetical protein